MKTKNKTLQDQLEKHNKQIIINNNKNNILSNFKLSQLEKTLITIINKTKIIKTKNA